MAKKNLEGLIMDSLKGVKRVMVTSDYHIPYHDEKTIRVMMEYARKYKPDVFVINGDFVDFYSLSKFDKNPKHYDLDEELTLGKQYLHDLRKAVGKKTKMYYLEGNHEVRLQKYLWKNEELYGLDGLRVQNLLHLNVFDVEFVGADPDYWKSTSGTLKLGDVIIMHGDKRLNGSSYSKYAGYSAKNTMYSTMSNIVMGHTHRMAIVNYASYGKNIVGIEEGCLSETFDTVNWQQGFLTFELYRNKMINPVLHKIRKAGDGRVLFYDNKRIYVK